ncbi:MAG: fructose-6-phosphate aldolase [bacterium]
MKIFLDTANIDAIKKADDMGILDGVTTNPTIISKEGKPFNELIEKIAKLLHPRPVNVEIISEDPKEMVREAKEYLKIADNLVMKVAMSRVGLEGAKCLSREGITVNMTLIFSPSQALLASKAGASYVSPFVGRLDDISHNGMELVSQIIDIFFNYDIETEVIVASIRHPIHFVKSALIGAHIATVPPLVLESLYKHPLTDIGIERFKEDFKKIPKE